MITDPYFSHDLSVKRLLDVYKKHNTLFIAIDFDDTFYDCHNQGYKFNNVIQLIKDCNNLNFKVTIFTASKPSRFQLMLDYCDQIGIKVEGINKNPENLPEGIGSSGKIFYNLLLDDRAGLDSAYKILKEVVDIIKQIHINNEKI